MHEQNIEVRGWMRIGGAVVAAGAILFAAGPAGAASNCKAKIVKKTGLIKVNADFVDQATLKWGNAAGQEINDFYDPACVDPVTLKARNCTLAGPTLLASKTPPRDCTIYVADVNGPCEAWIPGCVPGVRQGRAIVGYLWADQPSAPSYTPDPLYQFNSTGAANTVTRVSTGEYEVTFPGIATALGAPPYNHVIVTQYRDHTLGAFESTCRVYNWDNFSNPPDLIVNVNCQDGLLLPSDERFIVQVIE